MRIVYIAESIIPSRTANSIHVMKMCQALAKRGHDVLLVIPSKRGREPLRKYMSIFDYYGVDKCFRLVKLPQLSIKGGKRGFGLLSALLAKFFSADIVYGRSLVSCYYSVKWGVPVYFESHYPIKNITSNSIFKDMLEAKSFKGLIVISNALKRYYLDNYILPKQAVITLPDAADPPIFKDAPKRISSNKLEVGYTGHLYPGKGMEIIVELTKRCVWANFHIVGGLEEDIKEWKERTDGLTNITFHGYVPHADIYEYLNSFDVLLAPYQKEVGTYGEGSRDIGMWMSPLKLFEYMAIGKPILCSDLPVLREILIHNETAVLLPPNDIEKWIEALRRVSKDRQFAQYLGNNARQEFLDKYTWDARAEKISNIICEKPRQ